MHLGRNYRYLLHPTLHRLVRPGGLANPHLRCATPGGKFRWMRPTVAVARWQMLQLPTAFLDVVVVFIVTSAVAARGQCNGNANFLFMYFKKSPPHTYDKLKRCQVKQKPIKLLALPQVIPANTFVNNNFLVAFAFPVHKKRYNIHTYTYRRTQVQIHTNTQIQDTDTPSFWGYVGGIRK